MTTIELARIVRQMREAQIAYFRERSNGFAGAKELDRAKDQEKRVDEIVRRLLDKNQAELPGME